MQAQSRFITENKAVLITGGTSSAVAVALNKLAQREKVLFVCGISGSNDTTGKDCVRYGFRQCFYGQTAAAAISPTLIKSFGKNKKAAYLTPDYTYGHTVTKSMQDYLSAAGWTTVTNQVSPLGAPDYSSYLLNVANSGADVLINVNWGHDAVLSTQQAKQFGVLDKMKLVVPYQVPFIAPEARRRPDVRRLRRHRFLVDDAGQVSARQDVRRGVREEVRLQAGMGRQQLPTCSSRCGRKRSKTPAVSIRPTSSSRMRPAARSSRRSGEVYFRKEDHQLVRPVVIVKGKEAKDMKSKEDFYDIVEIVPGEGLMQKPDAFGCNLGDYT